MEVKTGMRGVPKAVSGFGAPFLSDFCPILRKKEKRKRDVILLFLSYRVLKKWWKWRSDDTGILIAR